MVIETGSECAPSGGGIRARTEELASKIAAAVVEEEDEG